MTATGTFSILAELLEGLWNVDWVDPAFFMIESISTNPTNLVRLCFLFLGASSRRRRNDVSNEVRHVRQRLTLDSRRANPDVAGASTKRQKTKPEQNVDSRAIPRSSGKPYSYSVQRYSYSKSHSINKNYRVASHGPTASRRDSRVTGNVGTHWRGDHSSTSTAMLSTSTRKIRSPKR